MSRCAAKAWRCAAALRRRGLRAPMHFWWWMPTPWRVAISSRPRRGFWSAAPRPRNAATSCELPSSRPATSLQRLRVLAFRGINVLRARGRAGLGFSAGIFGNGFAVADSTIERVPFTVDSICEDLEYHVRLVLARLRVEWVEEAYVHAPLAPVAFRTGLAGSALGGRAFSRCYARPRESCWRRLRAATGVLSRCWPRPGACRFRAAFWP